MNELVTQILLGLVSTGLFAHLIKAYLSHRHLKLKQKEIENLQPEQEANAAKVIIGSATALVVPLASRLKEAEEEASTLRQEIRSMRRDVENLTAQLRQATAENKRVTEENRILRNRLAGGMA